MGLDVHPQLLRALRTVLESGSLTAASERLGFTQSALSKQIAALEAAAGVPLIIRRPRGVEATEAGHRLVARASSVLDQLDAAQREIETLGAPLGGQVALGGFPAAAMQLVPAAVSRLRVEHPAIWVDFSESSTPVQLRRLRAGRLDLAIVATGDGLPEWNVTDIELEPLPAGHLLVAVADHHRLAGESRIAVTDLVNEEWIAGLGARGEPQFGAWPTLREPRIAAELSEWTARLGFVAAGLGITTVPTLMADMLPRGVVAIAVEDPGFAGRTMHLAHIGRLESAADALREVLVRKAGRIAARSA